MTPFEAILAFALIPLGLLCWLLLIVIGMDAYDGFRKLGRLAKGRVR